MLFSVPAPYSCTGKNQITHLKLTSGSLASYNYPLPYDERAACTWKFNMDSDYKIKLWFDFFNVSCKYDYVRLLNKVHCGSDKPPPVTLTTSDTVSFWSSGIDEYPGFKASYKAGKNCLSVSCVCLPVLSVFLSIYLSVCLSVRLFYLSYCLFVCVSVCLSIGLPAVVICSKGGCRVSELIPI